MACKYFEECPSRSGWCESHQQDYSKCVPFLINAYRAKEFTYIKAFIDIFKVILGKDYTEADVENIVRTHMDAVLSNDEKPYRRDDNKL